MAKTANGTINDQGWNVDHVSIGWGRTESYVGHIGGEYNYYVYCLQFTTPEFSGKSVKIAFDMSMKKNAADNPMLQYALCTSTENSKDYFFKTTAVEDDTQLASGSKEFALTTTYATYTIELETNDLKPNTTYYLYIWAGSQYSLSFVNTKENHTIILTYKANGGVRIKTSSAENVLHAAVIYSGGTWKRYIPVVYTPSGWKRQG